jgi:hypothetical protein
MAVLEPEPQQITRVELEIAEPFRPG